MKPKYKDAVLWIALNDNSSVIKIEEVESQITVQLIADMFEKNSLEVAKDICKLRTDERMGLVTP